MPNKTTVHTQIEKAYDPQAVESLCYTLWEKKGYFSPRYSGEPYCVMLPPPNVTGNLHMGHGFGFTLIDILIRYQRMLGKNTLWQGGTDHAGIATQMVVERKLLAQQGQTRQMLGRDEFIKKIWDWKAESGNAITHQLRRLGASIDWQRERFTMDHEFSHAVQTAFIQLYEEGLIYKGKRLVNWDPVLHTAISDLEVLSQEEDGFLWYIRYPLVSDSHQHLIVATTRPETLFGDMAVAVHPEDSRYQHLIGQQLHLPLTERSIPIIADEEIDPTFGTGCVKITPAHDFNDYRIGIRHHLTSINILTPDAHLNTAVPPAYQGMDRFKARKKLITALEEEGYLEKTVPHRLNIPRGDRSGAIIEPYLTDQWYIKSKPLAEPAIRAVENGEIKFIPDQWKKIYFQWMHHIEDWCISRQLWWGHRIPIWYDPEGRAYAGYNEQLIREHYQLDPTIKLTQEDDVLDTWFSSALWPFVTLGWPEKTLDLQTFFPTDMLITGFDILFFWVARMIMFSLKFTQKIPFKTVYITGLIRDAEGQKMSKSKGNVLDPLDLIDGISLEKLIEKRIDGLGADQASKIEKNTRETFKEGIQNFGTDALRLTFCALATHARDIQFDMNRLLGHRYLCNKLWNAARYVLLSTESLSASNVLNENLSSETKITLSLPDRWMISRLHTTILAASQAMSDYRFDRLAQILYDFSWNEFCDWYIELSKESLSDESAALDHTTYSESQNKNNQTTSELHTNIRRLSTQSTLLCILEALLRLWHPIIPFITEKLWQEVAPRASILLNGHFGMLHHEMLPKSIMCTSYPQATDYPSDPAAEEYMDRIKQIVTAIRTRRSEAKISPTKFLSVLFKNTSRCQEKQAMDASQFTWIKTLAKLKSLKWIDDHKAIEVPVITTLIDGLEIFIVMTDAVDKQAEQTRLKKEIHTLKKNMQQIETKLNNKQFLERAPPNIVQKQREDYDIMRAKLEKFKSQLHALEYCL